MRFFKKKNIFIINIIFSIFIFFLISNTSKIRNDQGFELICDSNLSNYIKLILKVFKLYLTRLNINSIMFGWTTLVSTRDTILFVDIY